MPAIHLPMKTAYVMEYVPRGARKPRLEAVSETVPVSVEVLDDLVPAVTKQWDDVPLLLESGGVLYAHAFDTPTTLAEFSAFMEGDGREQGVQRRLTGLAEHAWFKDWSLLDEGIKDYSVFTGKPRDRVDARDILRDERLHGLATAQSRAANFVTDGTNVYRRPVAAPMLTVAMMGKQGSLTQSYTTTSAASTQDLPSRAFRLGDTEGVLAYVDRFGLDIDQLGERLEVMANQIQWTPAGLAAENTAAWWLLWSADRLTRFPEESMTGSSFISQDIAVVRRLMDLAEIVRQDDAVLLPAAVAVERAERAIPVMEELGAMVGRDRKNFRGLMRYIPDEYRADAMRRDFDGMDIDIPGP